MRTSTLPRRATGWLFPATVDRERARDMHETVGRARLLSIPLLALYCVVAWIAGTGAWWWLPALAAVCTTQTMLRTLGTRGIAPELTALAGFLLGATWLAAAGALNGGASSPFLVWLLFGLVAAPVGLSHRAYGLVCGWTMTCLAAACLAGAETGGEPLLALVTICLLIVVIPLGIRAIDLDIAQRQALWRDPLTGALNRAALERRHAAATQDGNHACFIVFDLDHFKQVNDLRGHPFGDRALQHAATIAASVVRDGDSLFRLGGEEFAILLPAASRQDALHVAERARQAIRNTTIDGVKITASFGVAEAADGVSLPDLYDLADQALYRAKHSGRDQVVAAWTPARPPTRRSMRA